MDFLTTLETRKSCRAYQDKPVAREDLVKIVEAARLTPSACNSQPWKFIVVDEADAKENLCDALLLPGGITGAPWRDQVPAFIVCIERKAKVLPAVVEYYHDTQRFAQGDVGAACMNMCHAAMELGLSTCILGMMDQEKMEQYFDIPKGNEVRMILAVGYGVDNGVNNKIRKPFDEVCSFNQW